ncbi:uncharacterized protein LOC117299114 [Asterias rubens]|uniref:uncharacterized protein LOC117299114 n=1 Tax=Asterias rubens TaxID=7604 RepID=UPI00145561BC|nr:uncharacterized protein LOC117299114 [Asterias rubens]
MIKFKLYAVLLMVLCYICSCSASMLCYNQTIHTVPGREHVDFTLFDGSMETISCEDGFGCSKTLIKDGRKLLGVTRGCGIYSCLGKSLFRLDGFRLYTHCCQDPFCNSAGAVNSDLLVLAISLAIGWLIRTQ